MQFTTRRQLIAAPFWSRIPSLGLLKYPRDFMGRIFFWASALIYSFVYFFVIAFFVVAFVESMISWISLRANVQEYVFTVAHDIIALHPILVGAFILIEVGLIFQQAQRPIVRSKRKQLSVIQIIIFPAVTVIGFYIILRLMTLSCCIDKYTPQVLAAYYLFGLAGTVGYSTWAKRVH